jgi:hypothetical protein
MSTDCLMTLYEELRRDMPGLPELISSADERTTWLLAMKQVILAMPRKEQLPSVWQVSQDLSSLRYPSLPPSMIFGWLLGQFGLSMDDGGEHVEREG